MGILVYIAIAYAVLVLAIAMYNVVRLGAYQPLIIGYALYDAVKWPLWLLRGDR